MEKINLSIPVSDEMIKKINQYSKIEDLYLVFENTKGINASLIDKFDDRVSFSILGGLNTKKKKFDCEYYQRRTYYSKSELKKIVSFYEKIERRINPTWNDLEKTMFVYKTLCEYLTYEGVHSSDSRNLKGIITGQAVCSGVAMIFKEAMDRLGIPCLYQNQQDSHSWNVVKINNNYIGVDLTWDINNKQNNTCCFFWFGRKNQDDFYGNKNHSLRYEDEEVEMPVKEVPKDILSKALGSISRDRFVKAKAREVNGVKTIKVASSDGVLDIVILRGVPYCKNVECTYIRKDGKPFMVVPTGKSRHGVKEYRYIEYDKDTDTFAATSIFSEMDLVTKDKVLRDRISTHLLSRERVKEKVDNYNGYVGYTTRSGPLLQARFEFERDVLNIRR